MCVTKNTLMFCSSNALVICLAISDPSRSLVAEMIQF